MLGFLRITSKCCCLLEEWRGTSHSTRQYRCAQSFTCETSGTTYTVLCCTTGRAISCTSFAQTSQWWDFAFSSGVGHKYQRLISKLLVKERLDNEKPNYGLFVLKTTFQNFYMFSCPGYISRSCTSTCTSTRWDVECPHPNWNLSLLGKSIKWPISHMNKKQSINISHLLFSYLNVFFFSLFPRGATCGRDVISDLYGATGIFFNSICPLVFQVHFSSALRQPSHISERGEGQFGVTRKFVERFYLI